MKKLRGIICSFVACLLVILAVPTAVSAAAKKPVCPKTQTLQYYRAYMGNSAQRSYGSGFIYIKNLSRNAKITNVKSSNKHYTATRVKGMNAIHVEATQKALRDFNYDVKDGETTKLSFTVKQNGKSYRLSCKVTFKAHEQVFKTFKIGSKDLASLTKGHWNVMYKDLAKKGKAKIQIQTTKNYKIDSIQVTYRKGQKFTFKKVENGSKISLKNLANISVNYHTTVKPKYYKKPSAGVYGYNYGGTVGSPLYEKFQLNMQ